MRTCSKIVTFFTLFAVCGTFPAAGNAQNNYPPGRELASRWCGACHNTEGVESGGKEAPSFAELSNRPHLNRQFVVDWINGNNHPAMPNFNISIKYREEIAAYLLSFRTDDASRDRPSQARNGSLSSAPANTQDTAPSVRGGTATGFFVSDRGEVVTVAHIVRGCQFIWAWQGNQKFRVREVNIDDRHDLALLKTGRRPSSFIRLGRGDESRLGAEIYSIGLPLPNILSGEGVFAKGNISATKGMLGDDTKIQVSLPALPGSSGSPVLEMGGSFAGMITGRINRTFLDSDTRELSSGISFAIKSGEVVRFVARNSSSSPPTYRNDNSIDNTSSSLLGVRCENLRY